MEKESRGPGSKSKCTGYDHNSCCGAYAQLLNFDYDGFLKAIIQKREAEKKVILGIIEHFVEKSHSQFILVEAEKIYTMDEEDSIAQCMIIKNEKIEAIGKREQIAKLYDLSAMKKVQKKYKCIIPGMIDPHIHSFYEGLHYDKFFDMSPKGLSPHQAFNTVWKGYKNHVEAVAKSQILLPQKQKSWIFGIKYDKLLTLKEGESPGSTANLSRLQLDSISKQHPLFIYEANTHISHVNSEAFRRINVDPENMNFADSNFQGGKFGSVCIDGKIVATGDLIEPPAIHKFAQFFPQISPTKLTQNIKKLYYDALKRGCTSVHDGGIGIFGNNPKDQFNLFKAIQTTLAPIPLRVSGFITYQMWQVRHNFHFYNPVLDKNNRGEENRLTAVKFWYDGSVQGGSAYLNKPYKVSGDQWNSDKSALTYQELLVKLKQVIGSNWPVAIHCNGDRAMQEAVNAIIQAEKQFKDQYTTSPRRHRIQHCSITSEKALDSMKNCISDNFSIHPSFLINYLSQYGKIYRDSLLQPGVAENHLMLVGSAFEKSGQKDLKPSFHSDYMMHKIDPLNFMQDAVFRTISAQGEILNESQKISIKDALKAVTINSAYACYCEDIVGSLEHGKFADFVALEEDIMQAKSLKQLKVYETYVEGKSVCIKDKIILKN